MKATLNIAIAIFIIAFFISPIKAHEGMLALYADPSPTSCQAILPELTMINLSLFYIRGDGPYMGIACEFRLVKSSDEIQISTPVFDESLGTVGYFGSLESGIMIAFHMGENGWCFEEDYVFLGTIPIANISDPDTFTVSVVDAPRGIQEPRIAITLCLEGSPAHTVIGGTFVFNGTCQSPENPFQTPTTVQSSTWGAIRGLFR